MKYVSLLVSLFAIVLLRPGIQAEQDDRERMIMVYAEPSGAHDFPQTDVRIENYFLDGVLQEGFTKTTPFALEIDSHNFDLNLETAGDLYEITAEYMLRQGETWVYAGLTGRGHRIQFEVSDSKSKVLVY